MQTALIVPAWSDQAGQCSIVVANGHIYEPLKHYREHPRQWRTVGLMASDGHLVCLDNIANLRNELKDCTPLAAGLVIYFS